jgi:hypothetical protein
MVQIRLPPAESANFRFLARCDCDPRPHAVELLLDHRSLGGLALAVWMGRKVEAAVGRHVRVGAERDIGDRVTPGGQPRALVQPLLHHREHMLAARMVLGEAVGKPRLLRRKQMQFPMPIHRDMRLVAVLLEKYPAAQHIRLVPGVGRKERGIAGKQLKDCARFRQYPSVIEHDRRDLADRVDRAEFRRRRLTAFCVVSTRR